MTHRISIVFILFTEHDRLVAFAPEINVTFHTSQYPYITKSLRSAAKKQVEFWRHQGILKEKIEELRLSSLTTKEEKDIALQKTTVPLKIVKLLHSVRTITMLVKD